MAKVLLFSNDLMPFGRLPTSGGGLRCWQLYQGLIAHGYEVAVSMPAFTYLTEKHFDDIPEEQRALLWNWDTQEKILAREKPDAVLFASNWDHFNLSEGSYDVPLIVDLHGSRLIETTMFGSPSDVDKKLRVFSKADCLLSAGTKQRSYFYGWLVQAGRVPEDDHFIRYIPVSLGPDQPKRVVAEASEYPTFVSGGGWFPWQNQSEAIFATCNKVESLARGRVEIYGTPHKTSGQSAEQIEIFETYQQIASLAEKSGRINVNGYVSRDEVIDVYSRSHVALECMKYNLERELAFTTRTVEYLWCGLPVIYNNFSEISEHIVEYDAGWAIDPDSQSAIDGVLEEIFSDPAKTQQKSVNAQKLVADRFTWDKTIQPLVDFLEKPTRAAVARPAYGNLGSEASFLRPRGETVELELSKRQAKISASMKMPAEGIYQICVNVAKPENGSFSDATRVQLAAKSQSGSLITKVQYEANQIPDRGILTLPFRFYNRPAGGTPLVLEISLETASADACLHVIGIKENRYPFKAVWSGVKNGASTLLDEEGQQVEVGSLALRFVPAFGKVDRLRAYGERALELAKQGDWKRIIHAVRAKSQQVLPRLMGNR